MHVAIAVIYSPAAGNQKLYMAVENIWFFCLLSLGYCGLSSQEKPVSVELSCGAGPVHVVLEPGDPLLLECHLGASEPPLNVTWLRDGLVLSESQTIWPLLNGSLLILPSSMDGQASAGVEGGYSCLSTSSTGTLTSRAITLHLASLSRFLQDPEPQVVSVGGTARFECYLDGMPTPRITWEKNQTPLPAPTEPQELSRYITLPNGVLQILGVTKGDEGSYRCVAFNSAQKHFSQDASLTVSPGLSQESEVVIVAPPRNSTVVLGRPAVLECMAQGEPKPFVSWIRQDGKPIATDVVVLATNLVIPDTRSHHAGVYVCRANKPKTRDFVSAPAELRVLAPPVILQPPESVSLSRGNTARFVCNSSGDPPPVLRWLKNGEPVQSNARVKTQNPGVLLINQLRLDDAGYYQCIAVNSLGTACATAKLSVIVREGLPSPPQHVSATAHSSTSALLTWDPPEHNSDQIIGFSVHYQRTAGSDNMEYQFAVNNDTTELHVKELLPHTAYTFYVVAYSPMGASRPSQPITVEMLEDVPSASPQLSLLSTSPTDIRVMWLPLSSQLSRGAITCYRIEYRALEQVDYMYSVEVGGNETQVTLKDLKPNQMYQLRIAVGTRAGFSQFSEWASHHTPNLTQVLFAPTELKVRAKMHSLHVTWQPPPNHTQITGYKLSWRELDGEELAKEENPVINERSQGGQQIKLRKRIKHHEVTNLAPDRLYEVKVSALNKQTEGYPAVWKGKTEKLTDRVRTPDSLPPLPPISIRARANSSTSIWLRWEKPRFGSVRIINYTVRCSPAGIRNASLVSYYTSSSQEIFLGSLKPFTSYEIAVQSNGVDMSGPFSSTVEESTLPDKPSSPPVDLQLRALDSFSVLASWRPPLEPNGIILTYWILYTGNISHPDHLWINLTHDGSVTRTEVQGLMSGTSYYFKMGACTEVGVGPFSPVKDVYTPKKYELDIHAVTGIIVGVCLGLLCILLCMCVSFRNGKTRDVSSRLDSSSLSPQFRRGTRPVQAAVPDCHELETLMPSSAQDPTRPVTEPSEEQILMSNVEVTDDGPPESKPAWNGSVSRNWANRLTRYRDTITENSSALINGALEGPASENSESGHVERLYSLSKNQVEAEVIVHSQLSSATVDLGPQSDMEICLESPSSQHPSPGEKATPSSPHKQHATPPPSCAHSEDNHETQSPSPTPSTHISEVLSIHNGPFESGLSQPTTGSAKNHGVGLTNGFHSPKPLQSKAESLENGAHRLCPAGKILSTPSLSSFSSSGLVHSTSGAHSYLYP
ncbi:immunoglobulin superfamily DCC subclass member 4-like isoform X1 [Xyrauchen texanus]|uniref:immunoglobulin superfamily DCC subclass member 4-like isoform X1 n=1 Tax=Xyrauchen texanus TaxID=154827 RepID=UPI0022424BE1|nr:immunoglobulin superfamily DCC subclass member 4-like isoform X1 [Xyrauchen texanus]